MSTDSRQSSRLVAAPAPFVVPRPPSLAEAMAKMRGKKLDEIFANYDERFASWHREMSNAVGRLAQRTVSRGVYGWSRYAITSDHEVRKISSDGVVIEVQPGSTAFQYVVITPNTIDGMVLRVTIQPKKTTSDPLAISIPVEQVVRRFNVNQWLAYLVWSHPESVNANGDVVQARDEMIEPDYIYAELV